MDSRVVTWIERMVRLSIGALFVWSAVVKIADPAVFADAVSRYEILPEVVLGPFALVMPMIELLAGLMLVCTVWMREAALVVSCLLVVFMVALGQAYVRKLDISCGCFGLSEAHGPAEILKALIRDVFMLAASLWLLRRRNRWLFPLHNR